VSRSRLVQPTAAAPPAVVRLPLSTRPGAGCMPVEGPETFFRNKGTPADTLHVVIRRSEGVGQDATPAFPFLLPRPLRKNMKFTENYPRRSEKLLILPARTKGAPGACLTPVAKHPHHLGVDTPLQPRNSSFHERPQILSLTVSSFTPQARPSSVGFYPRNRASQLRFFLLCPNPAKQRVKRTIHPCWDKNGELLGRTTSRP
jgi:hypothetical protein